MDDLTIINNKLLITTYKPFWNINLMFIIDGYCKNINIHVTKSFSNKECSTQIPHWSFFSGEKTY